MTLRIARSCCRGRCFFLFLLRSCHWSCFSHNGFLYVNRFFLFGFGLLNTHLRVGVDFQRLSAFQPAAAQTIPFLYRRHRHAVFARHHRDCLVASHLVILHHKLRCRLAIVVAYCRRIDRHHHITAGIERSIVGHDAVLADDVAVDLLRRQCKRIRTDVARNLILAVLRVEHAELLHRDVEHRRYLLEMHSLVHVDCVGKNRPTCKRFSEVVVLVISHHIVCRDKRRHISARFLRQIEIYVPEILLLVGSSSGAAQSLVHIARTAVVGSDGKRPVTIDVVKLLKVFCSHFR